MVSRRVVSQGRLLAQPARRTRPVAVCSPARHKEVFHSFGAVAGSVRVIVFGDDPCPPSTTGEITVCARKDEAERYRIPESLRSDPGAPGNEPWTDKVRAYETVGAAGTASCSPVGKRTRTG